MNRDTWQGLAAWAEDLARENAWLRDRVATLEWALDVTRYSARVGDRLVLKLAEQADSVGAGVA
jgi:hypothetical protein